MKTHLQRRMENTELVYLKEINKAGYKKKKKKKHMHLQAKHWELLSSSIRQEDQSFKFEGSTCKKKNIFLKENILLYRRKILHPYSLSSYNETHCYRFSLVPSIGLRKKWTFTPINVSRANKKKTKNKPPHFMFQG